jgi:hypothetical protein
MPNRVVFCRHFLSKINFDPKSIPNLKLWLRADTDVYTTSAMTTLATEDSIAIGGWKDQSGQNNHVTQSTNGNKPVLKLSVQGGKPALRFTNASAHLLASASVNTIPKVAPITIFIVSKTTTNAPASGRTIFGSAYGANKGFNFAQYQATGKVLFQKAGIGNIVSVNALLSSDKFEVITAVYDATFDVHYFINGEARDYILTATDCTAGDTSYCVGGLDTTHSQYSHDGDIAEILVYARQLDAYERSKVENLLLQKYSITKSPVLNKANYLSIPDYPGLGTVVHPDVLYFANGWNGYKYWMAYSPFPPTTNENPCITVSNDGDTWITPPGLTNPIDSYAGGGIYSSDPSLCMSPDGTTTMYIFWLEANQGIYMSSSNDGITWSAQTKIINSAATNQVMSPSVLWDGTQFRMYTSKVGGGYTLEYRTCATITGTWSAPASLAITNLGAPPYGAKHLDVILSDGVYYLIYMDVDATYNSGLYLAKGVNGIDFVIDPNFRIPAQLGVWDYLPYRASILNTGQALDIFYSGFNSGENISHIARTNYSLPT